MVPLSSGVAIDLTGLRPCGYRTCSPHQGDTVVHHVSLPVASRKCMGWRVRIPECSLRQAPEYKPFTMPKRWEAHACGRDKLLPGIDAPCEVMVPDIVCSLLHLDTRCRSGCPHDISLSSQGLCLKLRGRYQLALTLWPAVFLSRAVVQSSNWSLQFSYDNT